MARPWYRGSFEVPKSSGFGAMASADRGLVVAEPGVFVADAQLLLVFYVVIRGRKRREIRIPRGVVVVVGKNGFFWSIGSICTNISYT